MKTRLFLLAAVALLAFSSNSTMALTVPVAQDKQFVSVDITAAAVAALQSKSRP